MARNHDPPVNGYGEPQYGSRLLPQVVDQLSQSEPNRIYATIPVSSDLSQGFRDITMLEVAQAVDGFAYWLEENLSRNTAFETISYTGISDLRYAIVFLAAVKCGYKLLVPSVRNTTSMNRSLLEQTNCSKFLYSPEMAQKVHHLQLEKGELQILAVPSLDNMIREYSKPYPFEVNFADVQWDPILILPSSGSTDNDRNLPIVKGRKNQSFALWNFQGSGNRYFAAFPPFHLGGFLALVALPIYSTTATVVLSPPERPPTGHLAAQIMQRYQLRALFCPPTIFEQLVQEPEGLARAKQLDFLLYAGGPLSNTTGSLLSEVTDVCQFYGSTETTSVTALVPLREDWAYLEFHPSSGADMQPFEDDAYEMVLHKDPKLQGVRAVSCNFPDVEHWHTKDLFRPHPTKPSLWQFYGRTDDIIVLSNGEKFNPVPSEVIVAGHHLLSGALIVGQGRFQAALLVEAGEIAIPTETLIKDIWPIVERANAQAPGHARIIRSMIKVAEPGKRFERAAKGTIIRKMTAAKFAQEIEDLYSKKDLIGPIPVLTATGDIEAIRSYVRASITLSSAMTNLKDDDDLYVHGLDSLKSAEIVSILKSGFGDLDTSWLSMQTLYAHPTVRKLSEVTFKRLNPHETAADGETGLEPSRVAQMASLVKEFTQDLPQNSPRKDTSPNRSKINVALTGSTGSLGTHLLRTLLDDPTISKIYCLNRSPNAQEKQSKSFTALYLSPNLNTPRVEFIQANYGETQLGLPNTLYEELTSTVDIIIHNAWKVDFNHTLSSFTPVHIHGIRNLIDWNLSSTRNPPIIFISSISSVGNWKATDGPVPEVIIPNHDVAQQMGYAESKHVSECILSIASETSGVPISILRVGQIAGPVTATGSWNRDEWFPSMIKTSQSLGYLPNHIPDIDWIPVDILASTILDILHFTTATEEKSQVYNIVNPQSTPWTSVINTVLSRLSPQHIQVVDLSKWIQMLEQVNQADIQDLTAKPAAKILDFYRACEKARKEGSVQYSTSHGISASKTMRNLTPVNAAWMGKWLHQLGY